MGAKENPSMKAASKIPMPGAQKSWGKTLAKAESATATQLTKPMEACMPYYHQGLMVGIT
jgi:hypothetical protein